jgi:hypothetical protein
MTRIRGRCGTGRFFARSIDCFIRARTDCRLLNVVKWLCAYDDKRYVLEDGINTAAYGHYLLCE